MYQFWCYFMTGDYQLYSRQYRRSNITTYFSMYDERLIILSGIKIYAYLAKFYCKDMHTLNTLWWDLYQFQFDTFDRLYRNCLEVKPPCPNIYTPMYNMRAISLIFPSVFLVVLKLALDNIKRTFKSYIYVWKFRMFKDCQLISPIE